MALMPKRVKYRKLQRGRRKGISLRSNKVNFGEFGLKALDNGWIKSMHIEAVRVIIARQLRRGGKLWIRIFPHKSVTKKPAETRMGKGKGELDHWVAVVKRGQVLFELGGVPEALAKEAFRLASFKLPVKTKLIKHGHSY
ncbi:MAG: 50S ribosomal protein L16 [Candidatus Omnitrophica bacterium CG11_big_fil_rev_8_21_14_0_20_42_13]|uniref:Large ribosomal subunit protein uL16 n=1 Tax=Candidatus Ghiorseimicrobium undicola TaxID=1974746 RepID=A0A2H0LXG8_9BACT|nr:MAG: 50S ribosomal protein L16 [Candidatus Omnitrophica bacterium CG11_big_fil_rev_8_21_14_0_20_42_13]